MVKKGRLSKLEIHYIKTNPGMTNEELASELDRSVDSVAKVIRDTVVESNDSEVEAVNTDDLTDEQKEDLKRVENKPRDDNPAEVRAVDGSNLPVRNLGKNAGWVALTAAEAMRADSIPQRFSAKKGTPGARKAFKE